MLIECASVLIELVKKINARDATPLRGFFGRIYNNRSEFHGHMGDRFIYKHPLIQYKYIGDKWLIMGLREGAYLLKSLPEMDHVEMWHEEIAVKSWYSIRNFPEILFNGLMVLFMRGDDLDHDERN